MTSRRYFFLASITIAISVFGFLGGAEIVLHFLPVATGLRSVPVTLEQPVYHFTPNRSFVFSRDWDFAMVNRGRVNNYGWVNDQDYRKGAASPPLLAIVGDSMIEALMVPYRETVQGRLAKALEGKLRVYSFAASGAPLSQYLIWAQHAVREYDAKALIINVVGNDFDESHIAYHAGPGFWSYVPDAGGEFHLQLTELRRGMVWSIVQRSALARYLFINMRLNRRMFRFPWLQSLLFGKPLDEAARYAGNTAADADAARIDASLAVIEAFLRDLPVLTGLPAERIAFTLDGFRYPDLAATGVGTYFDRMRRAFRDKAGTRGYEVIDLDPAFFAHFRARGERFDYPRDGHWNGTAHGVVAQAVLGSRLLDHLAPEASP
jgi:hypothetical protein